MGEWQRWQQTALPYLPAHGLIVELGSGTGRLASVGATADRSWLGIDRSAAMLDRARRRMSAGGPGFIKAEATALPLRVGAASAVVATFPARYIVDPRTAREAARVLAPHGTLVVVLSGTITARGLRRRLLVAALGFVYGSNRLDSAGDFALNGFDGTVSRVTTRFGSAVVYVGRPGQALKQTDDCTPPPGGADERGR